MTCSRPVLALVVVTACAALTGCGGDGSDAPTVVEGVIVSMDYDRGALTSFTVRNGGGRRYELFLAGDRSVYGFDLAHLEQHREDGQPVRCDVEDRDGKLVALTIQDA